ncbi:hypothetical protein PBCVCVG1_573R [Paramecium bursaria Chlorella virus CVG-1]|nr:hypothetical protein PBCVCVG1_573R [Paramecium bursaria Chlorella virus CVG-1]
MMSLDVIGVETSTLVRVAVMIKAVHSDNISNICSRTSSFEFMTKKDALSCIVTATIIVLGFPLSVYTILSPKQLRNLITNFSDGSSSGNSKLSITCLALSYAITSFISFILCELITTFCIYVIFTSWVK